MKTAKYVKLYKGALPDKKKEVLGYLLYGLYKETIDVIGNVENTHIPSLIKLLNHANTKWKSFTRKCKIKNELGFEQIIKQKHEDVYEAWQEFNVISNMHYKEEVSLSEFDAKISKLNTAIGSLDPEKNKGTYFKLKKQLDKLQLEKKYIKKYNMLLAMVKKQGELPSEK